MKEIKVILVDDHRLVRDGIKSLLQNDLSINIIGEASGYSELILILEHEQPDIIIMDISLPDISGVEILKILSIKHPNIKVLMLSMHLSEDFITGSIKAGAKGYIPKNTSKKELLAAIREISSGKEFFSDEVSRIMLKSYLKSIKSSEPGEKLETASLTRREVEILKLCAMGASNREIAEKLFISVRTVESHKNHIMTKFDLKSNLELLKFALKNNPTEFG